MPVPFPARRSSGRQHRAREVAAIRQAAAGDDAVVAGLKCLAGQSAVEDELGHLPLARPGPRVAADILSPPLAARLGRLEVRRLNTGDADLRPLGAPQWTVAVVHAGHRAGERLRRTEAD